MTRVLKAAVVSAAACAAVLAPSGVAFANVPPGEGQQSEVSAHENPVQDENREGERNKQDERNDRNDRNERNERNDRNEHNERNDRNEHNEYRSYERNSYERKSYENHEDHNTEGYAIGSPGFLSGNVIQVPIHNQLNICGNSTLSLLSPVSGAICIND